MTLFYRLSCLIVSVGVVLFSQVVPLWADCPIDPVFDKPGALIKHLGPGCTEEERLAQAIDAERVLQAMREGREIDLLGVIIVGNLYLDRLPVVEMPPSEQIPTLIRERLTSRGLTTLRIVSKPVSIRGSRFDGAVDTRLKEGYLLMQQPVTMAETTFKEKLDLSRTLFSESIDFSDAVFLREALFIQSVFAKPARFHHTAFGIHSRFHRAHFGDAVTFERAGFGGLAEFLEVVFDKDVTYRHCYFEMGTGFSGARFGGRLDASEAFFEREVFFLFTDFRGDASFRRSTFRGVADFSDAAFHGAEDFSRVLFVKDPVFQRAKLSGPPPTRSGLQDPRFWFIIAGSLLFFTALFVWIFKSR